MCTFNNIKCTQIVRWGLKKKLDTHQLWVREYYSVPSLRTSSRSVARVMRSASRRAWRRVPQSTGWRVAVVIQWHSALSQAVSTWNCELSPILSTTAIGRCSEYASLRHLGAAVCMTLTVWPLLPCSLYNWAGVGGSNVMMNMLQVGVWHTALAWVCTCT